MSTAYYNLLWYLRLYRDMAYDFWNTLSPMGYGTLLITVAVFGWMLMMRNSIRN